MNNQVIKKQAWQCLQSKYFEALLVTLIVSATYGVGFASGFGGGGGNTESLGHLSHIVLIVASTVIACSMLFALALRIFVGAPFEVGGRRYFVNLCGGSANFKLLGSGFKKEQYMNNVKVLLMRDIFVFLWGLLFVIPGIIKHYEYYLVSYLMAEYPQLDYKRAMELSGSMTQGHKFDIFVLQLSFIGWFLLGALCCGIGTIFVMPYYETAMAQMYLTLKQDAQTKGLVI